MKRIPNCLTALRAVLSPILLFLPVSSDAFLVCYLISGGTDMLDGLLARRLNACTPFGARFDSLADLLFTAVCLVRILPTLACPVWLLLIAGGIALVKLTTAILSKRRFGNIAFLHTPMNRIAGALLFALPIAVRFVSLNAAAIPACAVALFAAVQECYFVWKGRRI